MFILHGQKDIHTCSISPLSQWRGGGGGYSIGKMVPWSGPRRGVSVSHVDFKRS